MEVRGRDEVVPDLSQVSLCPTGVPRPAVQFVDPGCLARQVEEGSEDKPEQQDVAVGLWSHDPQGDEEQDRQDESDKAGFEEETEHDWYSSARFFSA